jgi:hypothetical protein
MGTTARPIHIAGALFLLRRTVPLALTLAGPGGIVPGLWYRLQAKNDENERDQNRAMMEAIFIKCSILA